MKPKNNGPKRIRTTVTIDPELHKMAKFYGFSWSRAIDIGIETMAQGLKNHQLKRQSESPKLNKICKED